jgi:hypothetical protein
LGRELGLTGDEITAHYDRGFRHEEELGILVPKIDWTPTTMRPFA